MPNFSNVNSTALNNAAGGVVKVVAATALVSGIMVASSINLNYTSKVSASVTLPLGVTTKVSPKAITVSYDILANIPVGSSTTLAMGSSVSSSVALDYSTLPIVKSSVTLDYSVLTKVTSSTVVTANSLVPVSAGVSMPFDTTVPVAQSIALVADILALNPVANDTALSWVMTSQASVNVTNAIQLLVGNKTIPIMSAEVSADEGSMGWRGSISLTNPNDYLALPLNTLFILDLQGEQYTLVVDSKGVNRSFNQETYNIQGVSPANLQSKPRVAALTRQWNTPTLASALVGSVYTGVIHWNAVDWVIPANRYQVSNSDPTTVVKSIAAAVGAVVDALPNGDLVVRPKFPVSPEKYAITTPAHIYTDLVDNLSISESYKVSAFSNDLVLSDVSSSYSDTVEYVPDPLVVGKGILKVYLTPVRSNYAVRTTKFNISLASTGTSLEAHTETIEFLDGAASVSKPIQSISSVVWGDVDLGGVTFINGATSLSSLTASSSLATVTYTTMVSTYSVTGGSLGEKAQFLVEVT